MKLQGTTRTEDLINSLPQSFAAQGSNISNGSTGTATVNLRGLGSARTLVLINGRRLMPGDPRQRPVADINFIPSALIKRVDMLTGGASSVYGADAVAGVVNFIMDTNFAGFRIDGQATGSCMTTTCRTANIRHGRTPTARLPLRRTGSAPTAARRTSRPPSAPAFDDDRGNIIAYATYRTQTRSSGDAATIRSAPSGRTRPTPSQSGDLLLRWLVHLGDRHVRRARPGHGCTDRRHASRSTAATSSSRADAVQLRAVQLLPASGRALHVRRLRRL